LEQALTESATHARRSLALSRRAQIIAVKNRQMRQVQAQLAATQRRG